MKAINLIISLCLVILISVSANGSVETRGGGNLTAAQFTDVAMAALKDLKPLSPIALGGITFDVDSIGTKFASTLVTSVDGPLYLNGVKVDAINDHVANTIVVNSSTWQSFSNSNKSRLVLHELIGLMEGPEADVTYHVSEALNRMVGTVDLRHDVIRFYCEDTIGRQLSIDMITFGGNCRSMKSCGYFSLETVKFTTNISRKNFEFAASTGNSAIDGTINLNPGCRLGGANGRKQFTHELTAVYTGWPGVFSDGTISGCCLEL